MTQVTGIMHMFGKHIFSQWQYTYLGVISGR